MRLRNHSRRVTQSDVAHKAGVSVTTVSLILSDRPEWLRQFHPDTILKVREAAERLGYKTNLFAAGLPNRNSPFVALIIRDFVRQEPDYWHLWAFEGELLARVIKSGADVGLYPLVVTLDPDAGEEGLVPVKQIIEGGVFGAIVRAPDAELSRYLHGQIREGQRIVALFPERTSQWPTNAVALDNERAGQVAGELLAARGCRHWTIVHYEQPRMRESHMLRRRGFQRAARAAGATVKTVRMPRLINEVAPEHLERLERAAPDGLFGVDSVLSICVLQACVRLGRQVGQDCMLVGMNCSRWHTPPLPSITSVEVAWRDAGTAAVQQLAKAQTETGTEFPTILLPPQVVPGDTCPCDAPAVQNAEDALARSQERP